VAQAIVHRHRSGACSLGEGGEVSVRTVECETLGWAEAGGGQGGGRGIRLEILLDYVTPEEELRRAVFCAARRRIEAGVGGFQAAVGEYVGGAD